MVQEAGDQGELCVWEIKNRIKLKEKMLAKNDYLC